MNRYFSFQRMITTSFVRGLYFLGFVVLTSCSIALIVWAGMTLDAARIDRALGWRYVTIGVSALILGNLVWRVFCEIWIVLFKIHDRLTSLDETFNRDSADDVVVANLPKPPIVLESKESRTFENLPRGTSVLKLS